MSYSIVLETKNESQSDVAKAPVMRSGRRSQTPTAANKKIKESHNEKSY